MAFEIYKKTIMDGGATLDARTLSDLTVDQVLDAPYAVGGSHGIKERAFDLDSPATPSQVERYVRDLASLPTVHTVGLWHDQENHSVVIDAVSRFGNRDLALRKAKDRGERAIFNLADLQTIKVQAAPVIKERDDHES